MRSSRGRYCCGIAINLVDLAGGLQNGYRSRCQSSTKYICKPSLIMASENTKP